MNYKIAPTYYTRLKEVLAEITPGSSILNAGCGSGEFNYYTKDKFKDNIGIDVNEFDIKLAKSLNAKNNIWFEQADITKIPFEDEKFDLIMCVDVLEHVDDEQGAIKELKRVLKRGGKMIITVPHKNYPFFYDPINFMSEKIFKKKYAIGIWGFGHYKLFDEKKLVSILETEKLTVRKIKFLTHSFAGAMENYIPTILQPIMKSNSDNKDKKITHLKEIKFGFSYDIPKFFEIILDSIVFVDNFLFKSSKRSVGIMVVATK